MEHRSPEKAFIDWFNRLSREQRHTLAHLYIIMTSADSGDFALSGGESLNRFEEELVAPEFPIRRISRLLIIKGVFNFIFSDTSFIVTHSKNSSTLLLDDVTAIAPYLWEREAQRWQALCRGALSDEWLHCWLTSQTRL
nr:hypothetical protein [uncultured Desulfuromonas sp.]